MLVRITAFHHVVSYWFDLYVPRSGAHLILLYGRWGLDVRLVMELISFCTDAGAYTCCCFSPFALGRSCGGQACVQLTLSDRLGFLSAVSFSVVHLDSRTNMHFPLGKHTGTGSAQLARSHTLVHTSTCTASEPKQNVGSALSSFSFSCLLFALLSHPPSADYHLTGLAFLIHRHYVMPSAVAQPPLTC